MGLGRQHDQRWLKWHKNKPNVWGIVINLHQWSSVNFSHFVKSASICNTELAHWNKTLQESSFEYISHCLTFWSWSEIKNSCWGQTNCLKLQRFFYESLALSTGGLRFLCQSQSDIWLQGSKFNIEVNIRRNLYNIHTFFLGNHLISTKFPLFCQMNISYHHAAT